MKIYFLKALLPAAIIVTSLTITVEGIAQTRKLPDGTIVYGDGTRKLPNGTVIYKDGGDARRDGSTVTLPDGSVVLPDGSRGYPSTRRDRDRDRRTNNGRGLPPGQAKKRYGGNAPDYAPGQQKKWKKNKDWKEKEHEYEDRDDDRKDSDDRQWKNKERRGEKKNGKGKKHDD